MDKEEKELKSELNLVKKKKKSISLDPKKIQLSDDDSVMKKK